MGGAVCLVTWTGWDRNDVVGRSQGHIGVVTVCCIRGCVQYRPRTGAAGGTVVVRVRRKT